MFCTLIDEPLLWVYVILELLARDWHVLTDKQVKPAVKVHAVVCTLQRRKVNRMEGK